MQRWVRPLMPSTGLCADGFAPQSNLSEFPTTAPDSAVLAGDNVTAISNITASRLLNKNELVSGDMNAHAPASKEIQMDTNGYGVVDETESQNQPAVTGNALYPLKRSRWIQTVMV